MKWNLIGTIAFLCTLFCIKADTALTELIENYQQEKNVFFASMLEVEDAMYRQTKNIDCSEMLRRPATTS